MNPIIFTCSIFIGSFMSMRCAPIGNEQRNLVRAEESITLVGIPDVSSITSESPPKEPPIISEPSSPVTWTDACEIRFSPKASLPNSRTSIIFENSDFKIHREMIGTMVNFNHRFMTFQVPNDATRIAKLYEQVEKLANYIYQTCNCLKEGQKVDLTKFGSLLLQISTTFPSPVLQRFLTIQFLAAFRAYHGKNSSSRTWVKVGLNVVELIKAIHNTFPRNYFDDFGYVPTEYQIFLDEMDIYVAFSWSIDFLQLYETLKSLGYVDKCSPGPFLHLMNVEDLNSLRKMIAQGEVELNPSSFPIVWLALINSPVTKLKLKTIQILVIDNFLDLSWKVGGKDIVMYALESKNNQDKMIEFLFVLESKFPRVNLAFSHEIYENFARTLTGKDLLLKKLENLKKKKEV